MRAVLVPLAGLLLPAAGARADVFNFLSAPQDITPGTAAAWTDVDVSAWVPAGATGVILEASNPNSAMDWGCRKNGSTDTWLQFRTLRSDSLGFFMIGVDPNRVLEVYTEETTIKTYLLGYTTSGVTFFDNGHDKSLTTTGSYVDIDISGDTGADTAIGAIFILKNTDSGASKTYAMRMKGSSDDRYQPMHNSTGSVFVIGVDASEVCQLKISATELDAYLVGYITSGAHFFTTGLDKSTGTTGSYQDVDITAHAVGGDDITGAFLEMNSPSQRYTALRVNGQTHDYYRQMRHMFGVVGVDSGDIFEQKIGDTSMDCWLVGYTKVSAGPFVANYRSVGTNSGTIYSTGTCSISSGTTTVTFAGGASLPGNVGQGDKLTIGATVFHMLSRDSATQATVQETAAATLTNQAYTITRAYYDFQSWETARQGNLVSENRLETAVAYDDGDFTPGATITIDGSTTDATHYMTITVAPGQRHSGIFGAGALIDLANTASVIAASDDYTRIEWLQLYRFSGATTRAGVVVAASNVLVQNVIAHDFWSGTPSNGVLCNSGSVTVRNCILHTGGSALVTNGGTMTAQNCTAGDLLGYGVRNTSGTLTATNVIAVAAASGCFSGTITQSYNMSSDATASGTGSLTNVVIADQFVNVTPGSYDLHLKLGSSALNAGTDLSGSFTTDVDGATRAATWEMGADEWTTAMTTYRSVGTSAGTLYSTGVASIGTGSSTVTFSAGASLPDNVGQGDKLTIGATVFYMLSRNSATQATVQETAAATLTNQAYTITRAYNGFQSWETARQGNLAGELRVEVAVAYDDGDFTSGLTIDGSTTSATYFMRVTVASGQRHWGVTGHGARIDMNDTGTAMTVSDPYTRLEWLQTRRTAGANDRCGVSVVNATNVVIDSMVIDDYDGAFTQYGIRAGAGAGATVRNCIVFDGTGVGIGAVDAGATLTVQNCTIYGIAGTGVAETAGTVTATNTIAMGCTVDFGGGITQSYNMSADASATGTGSLSSRVAADQFLSVSAGDEDLHLKASSEAIDAASDLSGSFTSEVDGGTRVAPWDMGADESGLSAPGPKPKPRITVWKETAP